MTFLAGAIVMQVITIGAYSALFIIVRRATVAPIGKQPQRVPESVRRSCLVAGIIEIGRYIDRLITIWAWKLGKMDKIHYVGKKNIMFDNFIEVQVSFSCVRFSYWIHSFLPICRKTMQSGKFSVRRSFREYFFLIVWIFEFFHNPLFHIRVIVPSFRASPVIARGGYPNFKTHVQLQHCIRDQQFDNAIGNVHFLSQGEYIHYIRDQAWVPGWTWSWYRFFYTE